MEYTKVICDAKTTNIVEPKSHLNQTPKITYEETIIATLVVELRIRHSASPTSYKIHPSRNFHLENIQKKYYSKPALSRLCLCTSPNRSDRRELRSSAESELRAASIKTAVSVWLQLLQDASQSDPIKNFENQDSIILV